jgi:hypothetical protein
MAELSPDNRDLLPVLSFLGRRKEAESLANQLIDAAMEITDGYGRNLALGDIAYSLAVAGFGERVIEVVQSMGDPKREGSAYVLSSCVLLIATHGYVAQVLPMSVAALRHASVFGLRAYLHTLASITRALAIIRRCDDVRAIHQAIKEVESWWSVST